MSPMKFCLPSKRINYDWASLIQSYKQYVSPSSTVLEIGASNLERTKELCGYCRKLIGLELLPERTPQDFDNVKYLTGDWQNVSEIIKPESIDIVISDIYALRLDDFRYVLPVPGEILYVIEVLRSSFGQKLQADQLAAVS